MSIPHADYLYLRVRDSGSSREWDIGEQFWDCMTPEQQQEIIKTMRYRLSLFESDIPTSDIEAW